jgi:hypothetical protein
MKAKILKNIKTALEWNEGVISIEALTGELYIIDDYDSMYKLAVEEGYTTLSADDYAREVCQNALLAAFNDDQIAKAGIDWINSENFKKMLLGKREEIERMSKEKEEYKKEMEEDAYNDMLEFYK